MTLPNKNCLSFSLPPLHREKYTAFTEVSRAKTKRNRAKLAADPNRIVPFLSRMKNHIKMCTSLILLVSSSKQGTSDYTLGRNSSAQVINGKAALLIC